MVARELPQALHDQRHRVMPRCGSDHLDRSVRFDGNERQKQRNQEPSIRRAAWRMHFRYPKALPRTSFRKRNNNCICVFLIYIYIYIYMFTHTYIYIYIYIVLRLCRTELADSSVACGHAPSPPQTPPPPFLALLLPSGLVSLCCVPPEGWASAREGPVGAAERGCRHRPSII